MKVILERSGERVQKFFSRLEGYDDRIALPELEGLVRESGIVIGDVPEDILCFSDVEYQRNLWLMNH